MKEDALRARDELIITEVDHLGRNKHQMPVSLLFCVILNYRFFCGGKRVREVIQSKIRNLIFGGMCDEEIFYAGYYAGNI